MPTQVIMPQLGESVLEGTITRWLKAAGETVEENEPLVEVNTDKVDTEIPSPASGMVLEILVPAGTTVQAGDAAGVDRGGEAARPGWRPRLTLGRGQQLSCRPQTSACQRRSHRQDATVNLGFISPVVAKMASEHGIDLFQVPGTGQGGRITKKDLQAYLEKQPSAPVAAPSPAIPAASYRPPQPSQLHRPPRRPARLAR